MYIFGFDVPLMELLFIMTSLIVAMLVVLVYTLLQIKTVNEKIGLLQREEVKLLREEKETMGLLKKVGKEEKKIEKELKRRK
jgi:hypothetical protein